MSCPVCNSVDLNREVLLVVNQTGTPFTCRNCGFRFLAKDGKLIRPLPLTGHKFTCPSCKRGTPQEVVLPVLPPRMGLECKSCKKIICYWVGEAPVDTPMASEDCFRFSDFFEDYEPEADPLRSALQVAIMETLFDTLPMGLNDVVKLFERRIEQADILMPKKRRRLERERSEELKQEVKKEERRKKRKKKKKEQEEPPPPVEPPEQLDSPAGFGGEPGDGQTLNPPPPELVPEEKPKKKKGKKNAKRKKRKKKKEVEEQERG